MSAKQLRITGTLLVLLGIAGLVVSVPAMAERLAGRDVPLVWFAEPAAGDSFEFQGHTVSVEDVSEGDDFAVRVHWRGRTLDLPLGAEPDPRLPGLLRFGDWLRVVPMAELPPGERGGIARLRELLDAGELNPRLVAVARTLPEGFDPETWGRVRRKDWGYTFAELFPDRPPERSIHEFERRYGELQEMTELFFQTLDYGGGSALDAGPAEFVAMARAIAEDYPKRETDAELWNAVERLDADPTPEAVDDLRQALRDRYWQYQAMLLVTPSLQMPRTKVVDYGIASMGWTWPAAGMSVLLLTAGAWMLLTSRVRGGA